MWPKINTPPVGTLVVAAPVNQECFTHEESVHATTIAIRDPTIRRILIPLDDVHGEYEWIIEDVRNKSFHDKQRHGFQVTVSGITIWMYWLRRPRSPSKV